MKKLLITSLLLFGCDLDDELVEMPFSCTITWYDGICEIPSSEYTPCPYAEELGSTYLIYTSTSIPWVDEQCEESAINYAPIGTVDFITEINFLYSPPASTGSSNSPGGSCCKVCSTGKACGDSCISKDYTCHQPAGCAC